MRTPAQVYRDMRQGHADKANAVMDDPQYWPQAPHQFWQPASPDAHRSPLDLVPDEVGPFEAGLTDDRRVGWNHFAEPAAGDQGHGRPGGPGVSNVENPREWAEMMQAKRDREPSPDGAYAEDFPPGHRYGRPLDPYEAGLTDDPDAYTWGHYAGPNADAAREGEPGGETPTGYMSAEASAALEAAQGPADREAGQ